MEITSEAFGMARIGSGLSAEELAERLGVSRRTIANWERNGVPAHRNALVMSRFGGHVRAAMEAVERDAWERTPEGAAALERRYEEYSRELVARGNEHLIWDFLEIDDERQVDEYLKLKKVVAGYSTASISQVLASRLADEARRQASVRKVIAPEKLDLYPDYSELPDRDATVDPAMRHEGSKEVVEALEVDDTDDDPDYSQMSEQDARDYGLAAYKGEENIAFDDIPHEP